MDNLNGWPDSDTRHVSLETCRGSLCHLCLKPDSDPQHITQVRYDALKAAYARIAA